MRNALLLPVVLLCITGSGWASDVFDYTPSWSCNIPGNPTKLRLASVMLDQDSFLDLVIGNTASDHLLVCLGNGDGSFSVNQEYLLSNPLWIETADIDDDLDEDVIVRFKSSGNDSIAVFFNNQDGMLSDPVTSDGGLGVSSVETASFEIIDFTGDGVLDLIIPHITGDIEQLVGMGAGYFQSEYLFSGLSTAKSLDAVDLDLDGDPDLVVLDNGYITVLINNGVGEVTFGGEYGYLPSDFPYGALKSVDLNLDSYPDIVTSPGAALGTLSIYALLGDGTGSFTQVEPGWHSLGNTFCHAVTEDFNLDGKPDAFFHGSCGHLLLLGDGSGNLQEDYYYYSKTQCWEGATGDFDLDGDMDYATVTRPLSSLKLEVFLNNTITNGVEQQEEDPCQPTLTLLNSPVITTASIAVTLSEPSSCQLKAFNLSGRQVATVLDGPLLTGTTELQWNTGNLSPGCYLLRLDVGSGYSVAARCVVME